MLGCSVSVGYCILLHPPLGALEVCTWKCALTSFLCSPPAGFKEARVFWEVWEDSQSGHQQQHIIRRLTGEGLTAPSFVAFLVLMGC